MKKERKLKKKVFERNGKKYFLLGRLEGQNYWLESASFDCGWYWGFGYIEVFNHLKTDILLHTHYNSMLFKQNEKGDYIHTLKDITGFKSPLTEAEQWELSDLMKSFYTLKEMAEISYTGTSHFTSNVGVNLKDDELYNKINKEKLPKIFERIYEILSK